jgi:hypothetical protein
MRCEKKMASDNFLTFRMHVFHFSPELAKINKTKSAYALLYLRDKALKIKVARESG